MKNTALTHIHEGLGAKMLPFAGYNMPILYEGVNAEHETVRNAVGVLMFHTWGILYFGSQCSGFDSESDF
jgi:glycine cleavage system aminomethyltransferase T